MGSRETPSARALRLVATDVRTVVDDLRASRLEHGLSQLDVARASGLSVDQVSRIERADVEFPTPDHLAAVAAVLGMRLRINLYPEGEALRDRVQLPGLAAFRRRLHPSIAWRSEVVLPGQSDRRAWDAVAIDEEHTWTGIEWISRVGAVDAMLRRAHQNQRDDPRISRVVLVIADTKRNRDALRAALPLVRAEYPLGSREVLAALGAGRAPALNGIVLLRVPNDRPHAVHNGGKVVDADGRHAARFVENRLGPTLTQP